MPRTKEQFKVIRADRKRKILESALVLFAEKGFKGTSISDIAKSAGISKGLAYNYFKDKNEIMYSVFGLLAEDIGAIFKESNVEEDPKKKLKILINRTFKTLQRDETLWRIYMNFALSPEVKDDAFDFMSRFMEEMFNWLEKIFKEMCIQNAPAESRIFGAILDGVCFHYIFDKEKYPIEKMRKYLISRYCK